MCLSLNISNYPVFLNSAHNLFTTVTRKLLIQKTVDAGENIPKQQNKTLDKETACHEQW